MAVKSKPVNSKSVTVIVTLSASSWQHPSHESFSLFLEHPDRLLQIVVLPYAPRVSELALGFSQTTAIVYVPKVTFSKL